MVVVKGLAVVLLLLIAVWVKGDRLGAGGGGDGGGGEGAGNGGCRHGGDGRNAGD